MIEPGRLNSASTFGSAVEVLKLARAVSTWFWPQEARFGRIATTTAGAWRDGWEEAERGDRVADRRRVHHAGRPADRGPDDDRGQPGRDVAGQPHAGRP